MTEKITMKAIAEACGVSIGTVDRALNDRGRINPETREKILQTARQMGYSRNLLASALRRRHKVRVLVLSPREPSFFFCHVEAGIRKAMEDMADYGVELVQLHTELLDTAQQLEALAAVDKGRIDGLVLTAASDALAQRINEFADAGIPVVTFNSDAAQSRRHCFVGEDPYQAGRQCGNFMGSFLGGQGTVAALISESTPGSRADRLRGFSDVLREKYPHIRLLDPCTCGELEADASSQIAAVLRDHGHIDGIFASSASSTVGVGRFFRDNPQIPQPVLMGYDVTEETAQFLKDGIFTLVLEQNPKMQSYHAVNLMCRHLLQDYPLEQTHYEIRTQVVTRENVRSFCENAGRGREILL